MVNDKQLNGIDDTIIVTKNLLGFRGPDLSNNCQTKVVFVGGSTTECYYLSDNNDWPNLVGNSLRRMDSTVWVNNTGISGQSTFGHIILMEYIVQKIKPQYVFFMVGINDAFIKSLIKDDKFLLMNHYSGWQDKIMKKSMVASTIKFLIGSRIAYKAGIVDNNVNFSQIQISECMEVPENQSEKPATIDTNYELRIQKLIDMCRINDIKPVFIAQTKAIGFFDLSSRKDLSKCIKVNGIDFLDGKKERENLLFYNKLTRDICNKNQIKFIELDSMIPKDSRYFYDFIHFNNNGAAKVSEIIFPEIVQILEKDSRIKLPIIRE